jgi:predicted secreted hydrolase
MPASARLPFNCAARLLGLLSNPALLPAAAHAETHASFGFSLAFTPTKRPVRNGVDGVSPGAEAADALFYYSITRMAVVGTVTPPCTAPPTASASTGAPIGDQSNGPSQSAAAKLPVGAIAGADASSISFGSSTAFPAPVRVSGDGWYDHEFGGNAAQAKSGAGSAVPTAAADGHGDKMSSAERAPGSAPSAAASGGGGGLGMPGVQWVWTGVQLSDGSELTYARSADASTNGTIVDKAVLVPASGGAYNADASLEQLGEWTSLRTFIRYGTRWLLNVPSEGLCLELQAVVDDQELISIVATPAYWEGQVRRRRARARPPKTRGTDVPVLFSVRRRAF